MLWFVALFFLYPQAPTELESKFAPCHANPMGRVGYEPDQGTAVSYMH